MPKKHLLYIHHDEFATVPKKSALVNQLLGKHFKKRTHTATSNFQGAAIAPEPINEIKPKEHYIRRACKLGHPIPSGRGKCMGKGCPFA